MENLVVIKTINKLSYLRHYLEDRQYISFDVETTGIEKDSKIIGFSVSADSETGYYVVLSEWNVKEQKLINLETLDHAKYFLENLIGKSLIMHNGVFDCAMVENNFQVSLIESLHTDTLILGHLLNENRRNGLKELGADLFGDDIKKEQIAMKESVTNNGGSLTQDNYELYKADADLIASYGAKDALLTLKLFYEFVPKLYEEGLDKFFYEDESMPLLKGPTYQLNTTGLQIDMGQLSKLKGSLEVECLDLKAFIYNEIAPIVKDKYPGTNKSNTFNIGAPQQLSWLLFIKLHNEFNVLTDAGRELCTALEIKPPYAPAAKREFMATVVENKDRQYAPAEFDEKTKKTSRPKKVGDVWKYLSSDADTLELFSKKYKWVEKLLEYNKKMKILNTYVIGIESRTRYGVINPSFLQHGTTSGRYSSRNPNFQNLPRDDKRIKACVIARPGKMFVGADYSQLEPRVFASVSQDPTLLDCFKNGEDFYSVVGKPIFNKETLSAYKSDENSFAIKHPDLRNIAKAFALATPYGTSAFQQSQKLHKSKAECQEIIDKYFEVYPKVELMMLESHEDAKANGIVYSLYGRPRRIPEAKDIAPIYGKTSHGELPYAARTLLNLGMNHRVQSSAASIMNRAAISVHSKCKTLAESDSRWTQVRIVLQVHDELVLEGPEDLAEEMYLVLKDSMENTTILLGVNLIAEPVIANNIADLK